MKRMFVRRRLGWGISPGDWRGWSLTVGYVLALTIIGATGHGAAAAVGMGLLTSVFVAFAIWAFVNEV